MERSYKITQLEGYVFAYEAFRNRQLCAEELAAALTMLAAVAPEGGAYDKVWVEGPKGTVRFDLHRGERYSVGDIEA